ncbi:MAG: hypothetical protein ACLFTK_05015 [Anaerolineales bacterium]
MLGILLALSLLGNLLLMPVMFILGLMSGFSGGGTTLAFQNVGQRLLVGAVMLTAPCMVLTGLLWALGALGAACLVGLVPLGFFLVQVIILQRETQFFFRPRRS